MEPDRHQLVANIGGQCMLDKAHKRVLDSVTKLTEQICQVPVVVVVCEAGQLFRSLLRVQEASELKSRQGLKRLSVKG